MADGSDGYIYFFSYPYEDTRAIKIGFAVEPHQRQQVLQSGVPRDYCVEGIFRGTRLDEKLLHEKFQHLRIRREWFLAEDELTEFIDDMLDAALLLASWPNEINEQRICECMKVEAPRDQLNNWISSIPASVIDRIFTKA